MQRKGLGLWLEVGGAESPIDLLDCPTVCGEKEKRLHVVVNKQRATLTYGFGELSLSELKVNWVGKWVGWGEGICASRKWAILAFCSSIALENSFLCVGFKSCGCQQSTKEKEGITFATWTAPSSLVNNSSMRDISSSMETSFCDIFSSSSMFEGSMGCHRRGGQMETFSTTHLLVDMIPT